MSNLHHFVTFLYFLKYRFLKVISKVINDRYNGRRNYSTPKWNPKPISRISPIDLGVLRLKVASKTTGEKYFHSSIPSFRNLSSSTSGQTPSPKPSTSPCFTLTSTRRGLRHTTGKAEGLPVLLMLDHHGLNLLGRLEGLKGSRWVWLNVMPQCHTPTWAHMVINQKNAQKCCPELEQQVWARAK